MYRRPLDIIEEISDSALQVVRGMLWFLVEGCSTWNLEQYNLAGTFWYRMS